jgi:ribosomal protein S18 acetylase RimI-like enzyme
VVGFATVGPYRNRQNSADLDPAYGEIWAIYVAPDAWGGGIGSALLDRACAELAGRGLPEARLWVLADNVRARRFYEHHGLFPDGERSTYPVRRAPDQPPVQLPEVRYARRLDQ